MDIVLLLYKHVVFLMKMGHHFHFDTQIVIEYQINIVLSDFVTKQGFPLHLGLV